MIDPDSFPEATAPVEHHADFLELSALRSTHRAVSAQDFVQELQRTSATEAILDNSDEDRAIDDQSEAITQSAFDEVDERRRHIGEAAYPFESTSDSISLGDGGEESLYVFLALLSWFGKDAGPKDSDGEKIFEEICALAAENYLGGPKHRVRSYVFGFPRRTKPKGFASCLDSLCSELGEGQGHRKGRAGLPKQKDGKLDVVAWIEFQDFREGKLITFGQCATGRQWEKKVTELPDPGQWCSHWMSDNPCVLPFRSFFVPHRVLRDDWSGKCRFGGILYDRCRIASLAWEAEVTLRLQWSKWSAHVLKSIRGRTT